MFPEKPLNVHTKLCLVRDKVWYGRSGVFGQCKAVIVSLEALECRSHALIAALRREPRGIPYRLIGAISELVTGARFDCG